MEKKFVPFYRPVGLDQRIHFGKHKGETIKRICEIDCAWIGWAIENIDLQLDTWAFEYYRQCCETEFENRYGIKKPEISKGQMEKVMERIEAGEADIMDKVRDHFTLTQEQEKYLTLFIQTKHLRQ